MTSKEDNRTTTFPKPRLNKQKFQKLQADFNGQNPITTWEILTSTQVRDMKKKIKKKYIYSTARYSANKINLNPTSVESTDQVCLKLKRAIKMNI